MKWNTVITGSIKIICLVLSPTLGFSQNLVHNPSFECGQPQCDYTIDASTFYNQACYWNCPTNGTTDTFSTTLSNKACYSSMPYTGEDRDLLNPHIGSILPRTGTRFAGIFTYSPQRNPSYREYLQGQLTTPLVPGQYYCAEMYVSVAGHPRYAANNLGIHFLDEFKPRVPNGNPLPYVPQVLEKEIITDLNWVKIAGVFKATSPAQYLIIGNFYDDSQTLAIDKGGIFPNSNGYEYAYYFIEDVSVRAITEKQFTFTGNTTICLNETTLINANSELDNVRWTTLQDTLTVVSPSKVLQVKPTVTTTYRVTGKNCGLLVKDTVTVVVNPLPQTDLGSDTTICVDTRITLDAGADHATYMWQDGTSDRYKTVSTSGNYSVLVKNEFGCTAADQVKIATLTPPSFDLGRDTVLCETFFPLKASGHQSDFKWSTGSRDSVFIPSEAGDYWVTVTNRCGSAADTISLYSYGQIFIPNVITPNADRKNDTFKVEIKDQPGVTLVTQLRIYNRWGTEMYSNNDYKNEWPVSKDQVPAGIYFYTINFFNCRVDKGWVQVVD